jgi:hypothetical protein
MRIEEGSMKRLVGMCLNVPGIYSGVCGGRFDVAGSDLHWLGSVQRAQKLPLLSALRQRGRQVQRLKLSY